MNNETRSFSPLTSDANDNFLIGGEELLQPKLATVSLAIYCPICWETLQSINREGVLIDACPQCQGVWLDRGELDRIIARTFTT